MRWVIGLLIVAALIGCEQTPIPAYDFQSVFDEVLAIDARHNSSYFNETIDNPLDNETLNRVLEEIADLRKNNEALSASVDSESISLLLDSREYLLVGQQNFIAFKKYFTGYGKCKYAFTDRLGLAYMDEAVRNGIAANSRLDKLMTEYAVGREVILGYGRPAIYGTNYGRMSRMSDNYKVFLSQNCSA